MGSRPSQTVGPFFKYGLTPNGDYAWNDAFTNSTLTPDVTGDRVRIEGRVFDGDGVVVPDAMLEIWQADAQGRFADPQDKRALPNASFRGFARCGTDKDGNYAFETIKPGAVPDPDGKPQAPHILLAVFGRGMLRHLYTRIYFGDEAGNAADPVLALVPADRRATLTAVREAAQASVPARPAIAGRQRNCVFRRVTEVASRICACAYPGRWRRTGPNFRCPKPLADAVFP
ncbi:protocatechuate 3,4-dioxygenase alpha subunit [Bradyrhizobium sp. LB7.2]